LILITASLIYTQRFWKDSRQREFHEHASLVRFTVASDLEEEKIPWGMVENRPCYVAKYHGLGVVLPQKGDLQGARKVFLLHYVNDSDNQGCRSVAFQALITLSRI
jgi:hypothetical protein